MVVDSKIQYIRFARRACLKEEFFALTKNPALAILLNCIFIESQGKINRENKDEEDNLTDKSLKDGWFIGQINELLNQTMLSVTEVSFNRYLTKLINSGWVEKRKGYSNGLNNVVQYRCNIEKIQSDLKVLGYDLPDYKEDPCISMRGTAKNV